MPHHRPGQCDDKRPSKAWHAAADAAIRVVAGQDPRIRIPKPLKRKAYDPREQGARCDICPCKGKKPVPPKPATKGLKLILVGEGPGYNEEAQGIPFIGKSGQMVSSLLKENGLTRDDVHITNASLCRPDKVDDKRVVAACVACCTPRLGAELGALPNHVPILALGGAAIRPLLGKGKITRVRGFVWRAPVVTDAHVLQAAKNLEKRQRRANPSADRIAAAEQALCVAQGRRYISGRTVFATMHPAFLLRGSDHWTPVVRLDFARAAAWGKTGPFPLEDDESYVETSDPREAEELLSKIGKLACLDIETDGNNPLLANITCIGVSDSAAPGHGSTVVLSPWNEGLVDVVNRFVADRTILGHNLIAFDKIALRKRHQIVLRRIIDSLIAHHASASHFPQGLAHLGSVFCRVGPWKQKFKDDEKGFGVASEELAKYNAADVRVNFRAWLRAWPEIKAERVVYERDMAIAAICAKMTENGIAVDEERRLALAASLRKEVRRHITRMRTLLKWEEFEPQKPAHIRKALYDILKMPIRRDMLTATGLPSTAKGLLESYADFPTRIGQFCRAIMDWRAAKDAVSEYLDGEKFRATMIAGRVHAMWKGFGTEVGRPATARPNVLNMPRVVMKDKVADLIKAAPTKEAKEAIAAEWGRRAYETSTRVREIYVPAEGHCFVYFDLSQSQMRQAAHLSGDPNFIETCKGDVHTGNARMLFPEVDAAMRADPGFIKGPGKVFRDICKNVGFAILFLAEADKVLLTLHAAGFTHVTMDMVQAMIGRIRSKYRTYAGYVAKNVAFARKHGYLRSPYLGRKRWVSTIPVPTVVANYPIIAGEADVMQERLLEIEARRPRSSKLIMWAYDAAIYECPLGEVGIGGGSAEDLVTLDGEDALVKAHLPPEGSMADLIKEVWTRSILVPHNGIEWMQPIDLKVGMRLSEL